LPKRPDLHSDISLRNGLGPGLGSSRNFKASVISPLPSNEVLIFASWGRLSHIFNQLSTKPGASGFLSALCPPMVVCSSLFSGKQDFNVRYANFAGEILSGENRSRFPLGCGRQNTSSCQEPFLLSRLKTLKKRRPHKLCTTRQSDGGTPAVSPALRTVFPPLLSLFATRIRQRQGGWRFTQSAIRVTLLCFARQLVYIAFGRVVYGAAAVWRFP